jgi:DNA mismatch repair protein MutS2
VALKTAGLFAAMTQAGLHIPADAGSTLPVFQTLFADIGDEQSIAASLSTFSAHVTNIVAMDRALRLPALVLLDEVGAGTDPVEGGALGIAVIDHFRRRGAHLVATTHYDALKSYASTTEHVVSAAFSFNPDTFAPTYRLLYGSPGRSLAIEIAARLGMPQGVIAAARANLTEPEKQLADHLARVDEDLRRLEQERRDLDRDRIAIAQGQRKLDQRDAHMRDREEALRRRVSAKVDDQIRDARKEIDLVVDSLKTRAAELSQQAAVRLRSGDTLRAAGISTGDTGAARADARAALDAIAERLRTGGEQGAGRPAGPDEEEATPIEPAPGMRVVVGGLGLEGVVAGIHGKQADVDVRGKRLRAALRDLRVIGTGGSAIGEARPPLKAQRRAGVVEAAPATSGTVRVNVNLQPRDGLLSELNVIGNTADEAVTRLEKFLDDITATDMREVRIVHGFGTGRLRSAIADYLKGHPLVERCEAAPQNQGGGGATVVQLKD